jgi:hypothetical protein
VEAVRTALAELQAVSIDNEVDPDATALAEAWQDLHLDLEQVGGPGQGESALDLDAARRRLAAATTALHALDLDASASTITPAQRAALDAAHAEVLAAEEQVMGRRRVGSAIRKRLDDAHAAERALLDQHGFGGYLDVILSGGRSVPTDPRREAAEREHFDATVALDALERTTQASPDLRHLQSERARLLADGTRPPPGGSRAPGRRAPAVPSSRPGVPAGLRWPTRSLPLGVRPVGQSLETAASRSSTSTLARRRRVVGAVPANEPRIELAAIEARLAAVEGELLAAEAEVARTDETLQRARRHVDIFEGELTVRAGEDVQRMKRFAAAEQLRAQIDAVAEPSAAPRTNAREELEQAGQAVAAAESAFEHAASEISELARRARKLAEELPIDKRPEGDPLRTLLELAERLREHADVLQPEIDKAALAVDDASVQLEEALAACRVASAEGDGVHADDLTAGLVSLLDGGGPSPLVLDEPFVGVDGAVRTDLLEIVRHVSQDRQIVLLTEDAEVLGWAIELPVQEATALPAEALLSPDRALARSCAQPGITGSRRDSAGHVPAGARPRRSHPRRRRDGCRHHHPHHHRHRSRSNAVRPPLGRPALSTGDSPCSAPPTSARSSPSPSPSRCSRSSRSPATRSSTPCPRSTRLGRRRSSSMARSDPAAWSSTSRTSATGPRST